MTLSVAGHGYKSSSLGTGSTAVFNPTDNSTGTALATGNLLFVVLTTAANAATSFQAVPQSGSGWNTLLAWTTPTSANLSMAIFYKIRGSGETTYTFDNPGNTNTCNARFFWLASDTSSPDNLTIGTFLSRNGNGTGTTTPCQSLTTTRRPALAFALAAERTTATETDAQITVSGTGWAKEFTDRNFDQTLALASQAMSSIGATGLATWTYPNTQANNSGGIQFAVYETASVSPVGGKTYATTWNVRGNITKTYATSWDVQAAGTTPVSKTYAVSWNVIKHITKTQAANWNVLTKVTKTSANSWNVYDSSTTDISKTYQLRWNVLPASQVISPKGIGTVARSSTNSITVSVPHSIAGAGDYMVLVLSCQGAAASEWDVSAISGATRLGPLHISNDSNTRTRQLYGVPYNAGLPSSYTLTSPAGSSNRHVAFFMVFSGVDVAAALLSASTSWGTRPNSNTARQSAGETSGEYTLDVFISEYSAGQSWALSSYTGGLTNLYEDGSPGLPEDTGVSRTAIKIWGGYTPVGGTHDVVTTGTQSAPILITVSLKSATQLSKISKTYNIQWNVAFSGKVQKTQAIRWDVFPNGYRSVTHMLQQPHFYTAHRGGSRDYPEMSMYAYQQSVFTNQYTAIEVSLARTSDGVWFGLHDSSLDRTSLNTGGGSGTQLVAANMTWAQVQQYSILGSMAANNPGQANQPYMRWEELIAKFYGQVVIYVDPKVAISFRQELLNKMDALPGDPTEWFVGKYYGVSGGVNDTSGWNFDCHARGYRTWGYFYESDSANYTTYAPRWDIIGQDYNASQSAWNSLRAAAPTRYVQGHIAPDLAATNTAFNKGAQGIMVSGVSVVAPSGVTQHVTKPYAINWNVNSRTSKTRSVNWSVFTKITKTQSASWNVLTSVTKTSANLWNVLARTSKTQSVAWNLNQRITKFHSVAWDVRQSLSKTRAVSWGVQARVSATKASNWNVRRPVTLSKSASWTVYQSVSKTASVSWNLASKVVKTQATNWNLRTQVSKTRAVAWNVISLSGVTKTQPVVWNIRTKINKSQAVAWNIERHVSRTWLINWDTQAFLRVSKTRSVLWTVRSTTAKTHSVVWGIRSSVSKTYATSWDVYKRVTKSQSILWNLRAVASKQRAIAWSLRSIVSKTQSVLFDVQIRISKTQSVAWSLNSKIGKVASVRWNVLTTISRTKSITWNLRQRISKTQPVAWDLINTPGAGAPRVLVSGVELPADWFYVKDGVAHQIQWYLLRLGGRLDNAPFYTPAGNSLPRIAIVRWNVNSKITKTRATTWNTRSRVSKSYAVSWGIPGKVTKTQAVSWNALRTVSKTSDIGYDIKVKITKNQAMNWNIRSAISKTYLSTWNDLQKITKTQQSLWNTLTGTSYKGFAAAGTPSLPHNTENAELNLGTEFYVTSAAKASKMHALMANDWFETATLKVGIYDRVAGAFVATGTINVTAANAGQWVEYVIPTPVDLVVLRRYRVIVWWPGGHYVATPAYFSGGTGASDTINGPLTIPNAANVTPNGHQGSFNYTNDLAATDNGFNASNYWADVTVSE